MSAQRLLTSHKTRVFIAKKWREIACGAYDIFCTAVWWQSGDFGRKHHWTCSQTMFPLFLEGYSNNQQFVIVWGEISRYARRDTIHWTRSRQSQPEIS